MATIFTKLIQGELPSHRVHEDDAHFACLDINPIQPGHTLVIPKRPIDYLFDMDDEAIAFVSNPNGNSDPEILAAAKSCPVDAIFLYDKETGEKIWPPRDKRFEGGRDVAEDDA